MPSLINHLTARHLKISTPKSASTVLTTHPLESNTDPEILVNGDTVPFMPKLKILGATLDRLLNFDHHCTLAAAKASNRINVLKALGGSTTGISKEAILLTYKAIVRPILEYGAPFWSALISTGSWQRLQRVQNAALRAVTGCHTMSQIDHLHSECKVLPIRGHAEMLSRQFFLGCHRPGHPCGHISVAPVRPPRLRSSLYQVHAHNLGNLTAHPLTISKFRAGLTTIHTAAVGKALSEQPPNGVLQCRAPDIASTEAELPRATRCRLAQLRSGFCSILNSYRSRIDPAVSNSCPDCHTSPHDVDHLFTCVAKTSTRLRPIDLWRSPAAVAKHLGLSMD
jgi:hypothetical protein